MRYLALMVRAVFPRIPAASSGLSAPAFPTAIVWRKY
jgi:hypothetical protein